MIIKPNPVCVFSVLFLLFVTIPNDKTIHIEKYLDMYTIMHRISYIYINIYICIPTCRYTVPMCMYIHIYAYTYLCHRSETCFQILVI